MEGVLRQLPLVLNFSGSRDAPPQSRLRQWSIQHFVTALASDVQLLVAASGHDVDGVSSGEERDEGDEKEEKERAEGVVTDRRRRPSVTPPRGVSKRPSIMRAGLSHSTVVDIMMTIARSGYGPAISDDCLQPILEVRVVNPASRGSRVYA